MAAPDSWYSCGIVTSWLYIVMWLVEVSDIGFLYGSFLLLIQVYRRIAEVDVVLLVVVVTDGWFVVG